MTRFGHAQVIGLSEDVDKALESERESMMKAGVDADAIRTKVRTLREAVVAKNAVQESQKRQLKATTAELEGMEDELYLVSSGAVDTMMAAVGKTSDAAKNFQRMCSRIRRPEAPAETLPVAPPPK